MADRLPVIGLVGGIGSGKSTLAQWVAERHPVAVINADRIGHEVLQHPHVIEQLRDALGDGILDASGHVQRSALAALVFGEAAEHRSAREKLEAIVHPAIGCAIIERIAAIDATQTEYVLVDAAVLLEAKWRTACDAVIFVDTPAARRQAWLASRNWSLEELARREASQWPLEVKRQHADAVVANDGTVDEGGARLWHAVQDLAARVSP